MMQKSKLFFITACLLVFLGSTLLCWGEVSLYAQEQSSDNFQVLRDRLAPRGSRNSVVIVYLIVAVAGFITAAILFDRWYRKRHSKNGYYSPEGLFRELCKAHEFTYFQQRALRSIAKTLQLQYPSDVFIEPKHLELAMEESLVSFPLESLEGIYHTLFSASVHVERETEESRPTSWFSWTSITDNPNVNELKNTDSFLPPNPENDPDETHQWDPSLWEEADRAAKGLAIKEKRKQEDEKEKYRSQHAHTPIFVAPPLNEEVEEMEARTYHTPIPKAPTILPPKSFPSVNPENSRNSGSVENRPGFTATESEETGISKKPLDRVSYKPQYPETLDSLYPNEPPSPASRRTIPFEEGIGERKPQSSNGLLRGALSQSSPRNEESLRPTFGSQILSSLIDSVGNVAEELEANTIRNHLLHPGSESPGFLREMKPLSPILPENPPPPQNREQKHKGGQDKSTATFMEEPDRPEPIINPVELRIQDLERVFSEMFPGNPHPPLPPRNIERSKPFPEK